MTATLRFERSDLARVMAESVSGREKWNSNADGLFLVSPPTHGQVDVSLSAICGRCWRPRASRSSTSTSAPNCSQIPSTSSMGRSASCCGKAKQFVSEMSTGAGRKPD